MKPFDITFRRLLQKSIPQLSHLEIEKHERFEARGIQLNLEAKKKLLLYSPFRFSFDPDIKALAAIQAEIKKKAEQEFSQSKGENIDPSAVSHVLPMWLMHFIFVADKIYTSFKAMPKLMGKYDRNYKFLYRYWIAQRQFALQQGHLMQLPSSIPALINFLRASITYRWTQLITLPHRWKPRIEYYMQILSWKYAGAIILFVVWLIILGIFAIVHYLRG